ncbi:MAG: hypothetical protein PHX08_06350 [Lachnospiraceae bacterium]|nr:hypothetical protein [Lachnospiraceae bacterium]
MSFSNIYGAWGREYYLFIPSVFSVICCSEYVRKYNKVYLVLFAFVISIFVLKNSFTNIYRDEKVTMLTSEVTEGIWKGCNTTEERCIEIEEIEKYIRTNTEKGENILFMDWASFGYLMSDAIPFSPSALDNMSYSYGVDNDEIMYDYFTLKNDIPDKIIYIDFGRDDKLSIEAKWKFNNFVNQNYQLLDQKQGFEYRVLIYGCKNEQLMRGIEIIK